MHAFAAQRLTVMGLGRFGGGLGVTRWLAAQGADILLTDLGSADDLAVPLEVLAPLIDSGQVELRLGGHNVSDFTTVDAVVASPAVPMPWDNRFLRAAEAAGIPRTTEIRLLLERLDRRRVIGVTGTAGKSTTSAMIHHALVGCGCRAHLGGNIGGSLLPSLAQIRADDWIVLELSSAMLHWLGAGVGGPDAARLTPSVAVITNVAPNHLDWHGDEAHYVARKEAIALDRGPEDVVIDGRRAEPAPTIDLAIPGAHNQRNAALAVAAAARAGLDAGAAAASLRTFAGLPHRLELVHETRGLRFYNDSKATVPEATRLAVDAFEDRGRVHLIAGGYDKRIDLSDLAALGREIKGFYTIGATGQALAEGAARTEAWCEELETAVAEACSRMDEGDVLLLSPGCASWDQFPNFEARGEAFARSVREALG